MTPGTVQLDAVGRRILASDGDGTGIVAGKFLITPPSGVCCCNPPIARWANVEAPRLMTAETFRREENQACGGSPWVNSQFRRPNWWSLGAVHTYYRQSVITWNQDYTTLSEVIAWYNDHNGQPFPPMHFDDPSNPYGIDIPIATMNELVWQVPLRFDPLQPTKLAGNANIGIALVRHGCDVIPHYDEPVIRSCCYAPGPQSNGCDYTYGIVGYETGWDVLCYQTDTDAWKIYGIDLMALGTVAIVCDDFANHPEVANVAFTLNTGTAYRTWYEYPSTVTYGWAFPSVVKWTATQGFFFDYAGSSHSSSGTWGWSWFDDGTELSEQYTTGGWTIHHCNSTGPCGPNPYTPCEAFPCQDSYYCIHYPDGSTSGRCDSAWVIATGYEQQQMHAWLWD